MPQTRLNNLGQTLLELIVVVAVIIIVLGAIVFATIASIRNATLAKLSAQATKYAQEALERVRSGRDRNRPISIIGVPSVDSWNGTGPIWDYHISENCDIPDFNPPGACYFNIDSTGQLTNIGFGVTSIPSSAEGIPSTNPVFKRFILISDDLNHDKNFGNDDWQNQKEVTAVVTWTDFSGNHKSRLTTILRRL